VIEPISIANQISEIERADGATALTLSNDLASRLITEESPIVLRLVIPLLRRRRELDQSKLRDLVDGTAVTAIETGESAIHYEVNRALDYWHGRLATATEDDQSRSDALCVLSFYDRASEATRSAAISFFRRISPQSEVWYVVFDAVRRLLAPSEQWKDVLEDLVTGVKSGLFTEQVNPPLSRPEVAILVSRLPYEKHRAWIYDLLGKRHPLEVIEDAQYLPLETQIELLSWVVSRMNEGDHWVALGGLRPIYLLLHAVLFNSPGNAEFTAESGRVTYHAATAYPAARRPTPDKARALEPLLHCRQLWEIETNLFDIFHVPSDRAHFATWLSSERDG
jgi:hypothetical protein